jgi:hypothetical protein
VSFFVVSFLVVSVAAGAVVVVVVVTFVVSFDVVSLLLAFFEELQLAAIEPINAAPSVNFKMCFFIGCFLIFYLFIF